MSIFNSIALNFELHLEEAATDYANMFFDSEVDQQEWEIVFEAFKAGAEFKKSLVEGLG